MRTVRCGADVIDSIVAHAMRESPKECCGVLVGSADEILGSVPARNLSPDPNRFLLDPRDHIAAIHAARERGLAVVGFYHSHPRSRAYPSPTDLQEASYPGHLYAIVGLLEGRAECRAFDLAGGAFQEVRLATGNHRPAESSR